MDSLSLEILQYIFQYLNPKELRICSLVCKEFNLASKYFKQSEKWEKMFNLESIDEYGYDIDLVRNYLKNGYRYIYFNGKINFVVNCVSIIDSNNIERIRSIILKEGDLLTIYTSVAKDSKHNEIENIYFLTDSKYKIKKRGINISVY